MLNHEQQQLVDNHGVKYPSVRQDVDDGTYFVVHKRNFKKGFNSVVLAYFLLRGDRRQYYMLDNAKVQRSRYVADNHVVWLRNKKRKAEKKCRKLQQQSNTSTNSQKQT